MSPDWPAEPRPTLGEDPEAPYPPEQLAWSEHLVEVHDALRGELDRLRDIVGQVRQGLAAAADVRSGVNAMTLRQNSWTLGAYCASYCRIVDGHHSLEDAGIFPHLRAAEPGAAPVLDRLQAEHVVVHGLLEHLDQTLVALVGEEASPIGPTPGLDAVEAAVDLLADRLLSHLAYEERELRGPLARHGFYA